MAEPLAERRCLPCEGGIAALDRSRAQALLKSLQGWTLDESATEIAKGYAFRNYHDTMAFVNAVAWIAHREDHHPDMEVSWNSCVVRYRTHAVNGLSENDFICAAKVDALLT